jgi:alcohol dehydrogenase class IV
MFERMIASFAFPTTIRFGAGAVAQLGQILTELAAHAPLVVSDPGVVATNAFGKTLAALPKDVGLFSDIHSIPSSDYVVRASR